MHRVKLKMLENKGKYLEVRPVSWHARAVGVFPPTKVLLLIDGHQCVVELIVHGPHTKCREINTKISNLILIYADPFLKFCWKRSSLL